MFNCSKQGVEVLSASKAVGMDSSTPPPPKGLMYHFIDSDRKDQASMVLSTTYPDNTR